ncbi:hypothetical protein [Chitinimonas arctica]|uniref:hypothetical protein n=1 Tax=Chitinimonas arctica TaxID=2594795 RepID=UPI0015D1ED44|nr:hypothetical protein [Chitinimonas arctica]
MITVFNMASGQQEFVPGKSFDEHPEAKPMPRQELQLRLLTVDEAIAGERRVYQPS